MGGQIVILPAPAGQVARLRDLIRTESITTLRVESQFGELSDWVVQHSGEDTVVDNSSLSPLPPGKLRASET